MKLSIKALTVIAGFWFFTFNLLFSAGIQDISSTLWTRLVSETKKSEDVLRSSLQLPSVLKAFVFEESEELADGKKTVQRYCFILHNLDEWSEYELPGLRKIDAFPSHIQSALLYLSMQNFFLQENRQQRPITIYEVLTNKLSYIQVFQSEYNQLFLSVSEPLRKPSSSIDYTNYLTHIYQVKKRTLESLTDFFTEDQIIFSEQDSEISLQDLLKKSLSYWNQMIDGVSTPLELQSFLAGIDLFLRGVLLNPRVPIASSVSNWVTTVQSIRSTDSGIQSPLRSLFFDKSNSVFADLQVALLLELQKELAIAIDVGLQEITQEASRQLGSIRSQTLESFVMSCFLFNLFTYKNLSLVERYGNTVAKRKLLDLYNPEYASASDVELLFTETQHTILQELNMMVRGISNHSNTHSLYTEALKTTVPGLEEKKANIPNYFRLPTAELVQYLELDNPSGHFAEVKMTVQTGSTNQDTFTKVFPIFSRATTKGKDLILLDFFWFAARHWGNTLGKLFGAIINRGIDLLEVEKSLKVSNIEVQINRYLELKPYSELWKMEAVERQNIFIALQNVNTEKNAVMGIFGGIVPDFLLNSIDTIQNDPIQLIERYPTEVFSTAVTSRSETPRKKNALILAHGKQPLPYFDPKGKIMPNAPFIWRTSFRMSVWNDFYTEIKKIPRLIEEYDIYEYIYDTSVHDVRGYGEILANLLAKNGFLSDYENIILAGHSMGGVVIREAANTSVLSGATPVDISDRSTMETGSEASPVLLGNFINKIVTFDSPHFGSLLQNFVFAVNSDLKKQIPQMKAPIEGLQVNLRDLFAALLSGVSIEQGIDILINVVAKNPEIIGKLFTEMVPYLDPLPGGVSLSYTVDGYMEAISSFLYGNQENARWKDLLKAPAVLRELNERDQFYAKIVLISSVIDEKSKVSEDVYPLLYGLMKKTAELASFYNQQDFSMHVPNDAVVTLFSQQMGGSDFGQRRIAFEGVDHTALPLQKNVIQTFLTLLP